jgi:hypothetical protein
MVATFKSEVSGKKRNKQETGSNPFIFCCFLRVVSFAGFHFSPEDGNDTFKNLLY